MLLCYGRANTWMTPDADLAVHSLRDRGVISWRQGGDDRGLRRIIRSEPATLDRGGLIAGDDSA